MNAVWGYYRINKLYTAKMRFAGSDRSGSSVIWARIGKNSDELNYFAKMQAIDFCKLS